LALTGRQRLDKKPARSALDGSAERHDPRFVQTAGAIAPTDARSESLLTTRRICFLGRQRLIFAVD